MQRASEPIRRLCLGLLLACVPAAAATPATVSGKRSSAKLHHHAPASNRHTRSRQSAHRLRSRRLPKPAYVLASTRIPNWNFTAAATSFPSPAFPPQDDQRIPRQIPRKAAALQGIVLDP